MPGAALRRGAILALISLAACEQVNRTNVEGTDRFGENTLDVYTAVPSTNAGWSISGGQLIGTGPATNSLLLWNGVIFGNGSVEAISARADDAGLVLKFVDDSNYFRLDFRDDGAPGGLGAKNLAIVRVSGGVPTELWSTDLTWARGAAHTVRFQSEGAVLRAYFDGVVVGEVNDASAALTPGAFGMRHNGTSSAWVSTFEEFHWFLTLQ
jgi:hypothetical protein